MALVELVDKPAEEEIAAQVATIKEKEAAVVAKSAAKSAKASSEDNKNQESDEASDKPSTKEEK
jgi:hypothetical protein